MYAMTLPQQNQITQESDPIYMEFRVSDEWQTYFRPKEAYRSVLNHIATLRSDSQLITHNGETVRDDRHTRKAYISGIRYYLLWSILDAQGYEDILNVQTSAQITWVNIPFPSAERVKRFIAHLKTQKSNHTSDKRGVSAKTIGSKYLAPLRHWLTALWQQDVSIFKLANPTNMGEQFFDDQKQVKQMMQAYELRHLIMVAREVSNPPSETIDDNNQIHGNWLNENQINALVNAPDTTNLKGLRDASIMLILFKTGLRVSELSRLSLDDVHIQDNGNVRLKMRRKGGKVGNVPMTAESWQLIKTYIDAYNSMATYPIEGNVPIFQQLRRGTNNTYTPLATDEHLLKGLRRNSIANMLEDYCTQVKRQNAIFANMPIIKPHDTRRSVLHHVANTAGIRQAQQIAQHSDPATTSRYLDHSANVDELTNHTPNITPPPTQLKMF